MDLSGGQNVKVNARRARMQQLKEKCDRVIHYLRDGKHVSGLTKNLQRAVRGQAKNYVWDESSKLLIILMLKMCHILAGKFATRGEDILQNACPFWKLIVLMERCYAVTIYIYM